MSFRWHIPGKMNTADLSSRSSLQVDDLQALLGLPTFLHNGNTYAEELYSVDVFILCSSKCETKINKYKRN